MTDWTCNDPTAASEHAIRQGHLLRHEAGDYIYMGTSGSGQDHFKHRETRIHLSGGFKPRADERIA